MRTTKAIIHLENLKHNVSSIKSLLEKKVKMCVAIKADAYGHGAVPCAKAAVEAMKSVQQTCESLKQENATLRAEFAALLRKLGEVSETPQE